MYTHKVYVLHLQKYKHKLIPPIRLSFFNEKLIYLYKEIKLKE